MRRTLAFGAVTAAALGGAVLHYAMPASADNAVVKPAPSAIPVTVAQVARHDIPVVLSGLGTAQAFNTVAIHPQAEGQLVKIAFSEGQEVHTGDLLAQIDPRSYQAALDQAQAKKAQDEAMLANARLDEKRYATLVEKNYIARQQLDTTKAQVSQFEAMIKGDEAAVQAARIQLGYTTIRSPIDGRAGIRQIDVGNVVHSVSMSSPSSSSSPSTPGGSDTVVVITQLHPISVVFTLPQEQLSTLALGGPALKREVAVYDRSGTQALDQGHLEVIDNQIDYASGTVKLKATLPNKNGQLWPGQFVTAKLLVDTKTSALTIAATALQKGPDKNDFVYVVNADNAVETRPVSVGTIANEFAEITQGLAEGETVVTAGQFRLRPGSKVILLSSTSVPTAAADTKSVPKPE